MTQYVPPKLNAEAKQRLSDLIHAAVDTQKIQPSSSVRPTRKAPCMKTARETSYVDTQRLEP